MPKLVHETTALTERSATATSGRMLVHAITAGLGSSGYYSPDVLREAATNGLIAKGTPLYLDHASESERRDRPERSVRDIAAVFTEAAAYDDIEEALVGEIQVFAPYRELLAEMAPHIGLSISGSATDITEGEIEGRRVPVVEGLAAIDSVDFVTRAGRGGRVVELLESARANKRAIEHGIDESTVNDDREALHSLLKDTYGADKTYVWVRDFDAEQVWFEIEAPDSAGIYGQAYTRGDDGVVALTGEHHEVRIATTYVPVTRPGSTTTTESQEDTMPQIEEARLRQLEEASGRVPTLEAERDTAVAERDEARTTLATERRTHRAQAIVTERATAEQVQFSALEVRGLLTDLPLTEAGELDETTFTTTVNEAAADAKARAGAGQVTGFGASTGDAQTTEAAKPTVNAWGRPIKNGA